MKNNEIIYDFQEHLSSEFPSQIVIDVTEQCNLACIHCPHEEFSKSDYYKGRHLDTGLNKKLVDETAADGYPFCKYLRYTAQGEPFIHPNLIEMLEYAVKFSKTSVNVTTNGKILTKEKASALLETGVNVIDISIDAHKDETYAAIRKKGNLKETRFNVLQLIELKKKKKYQSKIVVSYVEQELNRDETNDFEKFWKEAGANYVVIRRMHSCAGAKPEKAKEMRSQQITRKPCLYPWERLVLEPSGYIGFCPADWLGKSKITNFENTSIKNIWQGDFMNNLRKAHLENDFKDHSFCGLCPDWAAMRWPNEGRAYSDMMQEFSDKK